MATQFQPAPASKQVSIRRAKPEDAAECGRIYYEAFNHINAQHSFPPHFPDAQVATRVLAWIVSHPRFYSVVAELDGKVVGSNCLDERSPVGALARSRLIRRFRTKVSEGH